MNSSNLKKCGFKLTSVCSRKQLLLIALLSCLSYNLSAQYFVGYAPSSPGKYQKTLLTFNTIPKTERTLATKLLNGMVDAVKSAYPQPIGNEIGPYGGDWTNYRGNSEFKNSPYIVHLTIPFYELFNTNKGETTVNDEYSSSVEIWVNWAKFFLQVNPIQYGNDRVFRAPRLGNPVNGIPKYNNMIVIIPEGKKLPWRPATKQEYLENYIEGLKGSLPGRSSTEEERQRIPNAEKLLASMSPAEKNQVAYLRKMKYGNLKTGYPDFGPNWAGFCSPSDTTAEQLVIVDESYYDKTLPKNSYQLIVIERRYPRATVAAAAPTQTAIKHWKDISDRINEIVRSQTFTSGFQQLLGQRGIDYVQNKNNVTP